MSLLRTSAASFVARPLGRSIAPAAGRAFSSTSPAEAHKEVKFSNDGRAAMLAGVNLLANAVSVTLGPKGESPHRSAISAYKADTRHSREKAFRSH